MNILRRKTPYAGDTEYLDMDSTYTKINITKKYHVSHITCPVSCVYNLSLTSLAAAKDPPYGNSPIVYGGGG